MPFSAIGNMISGLFNYSSQQRTNNENAWLAQRQNDWNRQLWLAQTTYNDPINQVQRLKAAGLNPAIMYGSGIENTAGTPPEMVSSQAVAPSIGSPFASLSRDLMNAELTESQIKLNESQANRNNAQAGLYTTQTDIAGVRLKILSKNGEELSDLQLQSIRQGIENMKAEFDNISADTALKILEGEKLRNYIDQIQPAELQKLQSEIGLNEAQTKQILELLPYEMMLKKAMASNQYAQAKLANANARFQEMLNNSDLYVREFINSVRLDNEGKVIAMDINLGEHQFEAGAGSSISGHYGGDYANVSRPGGTSSKFASGLGSVLGYAGKIFSFIAKY